MSSENEKYIREFPYRCDAFPYVPKTMLAPMEGVTDITIRNAMAEIGGIGLLCTEFVRISCSVISNKSLKKAVIKTPGVPLSVQIMGNDASKMADSAEKVEIAGADVVDINLGCPTKKAVKGNVGSAMLKDPDLLYNVVSAMRSKVKGWMSAKIRAGFDESNHVTTIAKTVEATGADFLIVHPRRRKDFYQGVADWRIIGHLKEVLNIPVIGNGDIWYPEDAARIMQETGCDGVMIGRGAMRNPWIFKQIEDENFQPEKEDLIQYFQSLSQAFLEQFDGRDHAVLNRLKELIRYFSFLFEGGVEFRSQILRKLTLQEFLDFLAKFIEQTEVNQIDFRGHLEMMKSGYGN